MKKQVLHKAVALIIVIGIILSFAALPLSYFFNK